MDQARRRIDDLERRWSRFLPDTEVSRLNRRAGSAVAVSPETIELVERSIEAWWLSGGSFDPTVLGDVTRAGYDRTFEQLGPSPESGTSFLRGGVSGIVVTDGTVRLPPGTGFDPGGIGKGLAADMVCAETMAAGADGVCVNLGGDVRVTGTGPDGAAWTIDVEHAWSDRLIARLGVGDGAVATSTTLHRRWTTNGEARHHLIDPHTGRPSMTDVNHVTVLAARA